MCFRVWVVGYIGKHNNCEFPMKYCFFKRSATKYFERMANEFPDLKWYMGRETVFL